MTELEEWYKQVTAGMDHRDTYPCDPECECGGIGYYRKDLPTSHKEFGRIEPCPNRKRVYPIKRYGITKNEIDLLDWKQVWDIENAVNAAKVVQKVMKRGYGWVFMWGGFGIGKTLILKVAVAEYLRGSHEAAYTRMSGILDNLRSAYDDEHGNTQALLRLDRWAKLDLLAIDEFEKVRNTEFSDEKRFELMDERYEAVTRRHEGITLMASNEPHKQLPGYLADRIDDGRFSVVELSGTSLRSGMLWEDG